MYERFRSINKEYSIKPHKVFNFIDDLLDEIKLGRGLRKGQGELIPVFSLQVEFDGNFEAYSQHKHYEIDALKGRRLFVTSEVVAGSSRCIFSPVELACLSIPKMGNTTIFSIGDVKDLAVNPEPLYRVAEKYLR
ncbi:hypothetical protein COV93_06410 [Candidatus Woesearchaeota archaeon CG11_big_fil_rev_8_21_14_0_20_43_8]|nr:MAG: hypothetical protein COV93_06410 [Candidatus Woesearchaeota archaeon CG11_big_fil_rev_8_21_14_0_20_43_8]PIO06693.1 MAG: hypothetical protein COT47_03155 [Candidatus Woesearchaeota archaeon CG08_land_8_20_14_0_20_43_7]